MSRPTSRSSKPVDSPFAALHRQLLEKTYIPPYAEGWRSAEEVGKEMGLGKRAAQNWLSKQLRAGYVERWFGKAYIGRHAVPAARYRVKPTSAGAAGRG